MNLPSVSIDPTYVPGRYLICDDSCYRVSVLNAVALLCRSTPLLLLVQSTVVYLCVPYVTLVFPPVYI